MEDMNANKDITQEGSASKQRANKNSWKEFFTLGEVGGYFFRKKDPSRPSNINIKMMHGINRISIVIFLLAIIFLILKRFLQVDTEHFRSYCISKKGVTEEFPFGEEVLVYKVMGKMFVLADFKDFSSINLKVDPEVGIELRERYMSVQEAYHMNKKHWITVLMDGKIPDKLVHQWIDNSYELVKAGLSKQLRAKLESI